eukprot:scaffold155994_cov14-Tisochrysis_lutea.AAC.2
MAPKKKEEVGRVYGHAIRFRWSHSSFLQWELDFSWRPSQSSRLSLSSAGPQGAPSPWAFQVQSEGRGYAMAWGSQHSVGSMQTHGGSPC